MIGNDQCATVASLTKSLRRAFARHSPLKNRFLHAMHMPEARDYDAAVAALNTLQSNFSVLDAIRKSGKARNKDAIPEMQEWCRKVGYQPADLNRLNAIHIAGTKGKGSTSAFISSILCQYLTDTNLQSDEHSYPLRKIGLYTSPHLRSVRERIQINHQPLSEPYFAKYFFEVWDRLEASASKETSSPSTNPENPTKPVYFRYLTLMAFHAYLCEGVDTAVIECGIGGEYDSTNILERPSVAAVTSLGIDHTAVLGETIEEIAWHKAGIFKSTSKTGQVFTVDSQPAPAMAVLKQRAEAAGVELCIVSRHPDIDSGAIELGLAADFQKTNASLAVAVAAAHLRALGISDIPYPLTKGPLPARFVRGLEKVTWGGRCEVRREGNIVWHLDGGHTLDSIRLAGQWFGSRMLEESQNGRSKKQKRILLFNQQTRDAPALARTLYTALSQVLLGITEKTLDGVADTDQPHLFTHALFSTNITYNSTAESSHPAIKTTGDAPKTATRGRYKADLMSMNTSATDVSKLTVQKGLADVWATLDPVTDVEVVGTIEDAIKAVRAIAQKGEEDHGIEADQIMVLVTGSLHLVGGVLEVLETTTEGGGRV